MIVAGIGLLILAILIFLRHKKTSAEEIAQAAQLEDSGRVSNKPFVPGSGSRSTRNNNPFNLRISSAPWNGKVPKNLNTDGSFEQFYELKYGVRAGLKNMINKVNRNGLNTIRKLIPVLTPPNENNTAKYILDASKMTGIQPDQQLVMDRPTAISLGLAIARLEGTRIDRDAIEDGFDLI